jgi:hypothetical protein
MKNKLTVDGIFCDLEKAFSYVNHDIIYHMLVSRLMQKGPRKRHLVAEACTTTGMPTREQF